MAECSSSPTLTSTIQDVGQVVFTTTIETVTTPEPELSTSLEVTTVCSTNSTSPISTSCSTSTITEIITIPADPITTFVTEVTSTPTTREVPTTLFTTICPPDVDPPPPPPSSPPPPPPTSDDNNQSSYTPPPTSPSSGSAGGSSTGSLGDTSASSAPTDLSQDDGGGEGTNVAPIVGGVIGGFVGLVAIVMITWFFIKKSTGSGRFDRMFNKGLELEDDIQPTGHPEKPFPPKPGAGQYGYNPVSQEPIGHGPNSGGLHNQGGFGQYQDTAYHPNAPQGQGPHDMFTNSTGYQPGGNEYNPYSPGESHHVRTPSAAPLLGGLGAAAAAATGHAVAGSSSRPSTNSGRPSTGGSMQPLLQHQQVYGPVSNYDNAPPSGYPSNHGQHPPQGFSYPPSSNLSHSLSAGSSSAGASSVSPYGHGPYVQHGVPPPGIATTMAGGLHQRDESVTSVGRSGSPVSIQNTQVLQVMNPEPSNYGEGSSSGAAGSGSGTATQYDGKGRPVNTRGEKAPIVHLDGGRYEEPIAPAEGTTQPSSGPAPPAYSPS
ncbi:hypothetical protein CC1G_10563 [Coprinopsis cinerea okayama7|uniref:Uncharacterized protein n=1 Tax=Coprinopsis cinerea (strain Okayama-7 / 130 / ATCC MYA-4618 / FGSC 9003) TaxID=240176 RepID=A8NDX7_COPC7|nr:hypothetical protein CC1G_10563 [Coprinopsis cinerea okayama7\|eukprot:XP_001832887.1 hypothetical protein CC1G_10563 [Coprinopsis cinerea okayama7\